MARGATVRVDADTSNAERGLRALGVPLVASGAVRGLDSTAVSARGLGAPGRDGALVGRRGSRRARCGRGNGSPGESDPRGD